MDASGDLEIQPEGTGFAPGHSPIKASFRGSDDG